MKEENNDSLEQYLPPQKIENREHMAQTMAVIFKDLNEVISLDQTGAFSITSAQGNWYIKVMENRVAGSILATGIKLRKKEYLIEGFITMYKTLNASGITPVLYQNIQWN